MGTCSRIATNLDEDMLYRRGVTIEPKLIPDNSLRQKPGSEVALELGGRFLLRYLLDSQMGFFDSSSPDYKNMGKFISCRQFVTPTPYSPEEALYWLGLPAPNRLRLYVLFLKPEEIPVLKGPRWAKGFGIEYLLPDGFPSNAIADIGPTPGVGWPVFVT